MQGSNLTSCVSLWPLAFLSWWGSMSATVWVISNISISISLFLYLSPIKCFGYIIISLCVSMIHSVKWVTEKYAFLEQRLKEKEFWKFCQLPLLWAVCYLWIYWLFLYCLYFYEPSSLHATSERGTKAAQSRLTLSNDLSQRSFDSESHIQQEGSRLGSHSSVKAFSFFIMP